MMTLKAAFCAVMSRMQHRLVSSPSLEHVLLSHHLDVLKMFIHVQKICVVCVLSITNKYSHCGWEIVCAMPICIYTLISHMVITLVCQDPHQKLTTTTLWTKGRRTLLKCGYIYTFQPCYARGFCHLDKKVAERRSDVFRPPDNYDHHCPKFFT